MTVYSSSRGADVISSISDDLWIEILSRLPLKPLFRFNCVSKAWHALISDNYLRRKLPPVTSGVYYVSAGPSTEPRHACVSDGRLVDSRLDFFPFRASTSIVDCSNGLLLCYSSLPAAFYVCDPITRRWTALPPPEKRTQLSVLAYDPYLSPHFKVVCFTEWRSRGALLEVFSSETARWAEQEMHWGVETGTMSATMHYFEGALYVLAQPQCMVGIDLETMNCSRVELPEPVRPGGIVGRSHGRLHYAVRDGKMYRIWALEEAAESKWALRHSSGKFPEPSPGGGGRFDLLAFHPEADVVYVWVPGRILSYDMGEKRFDGVCDIGSEKERAYPIQISSFPFKACLASGR